MRRTAILVLVIVAGMLVVAHADASGGLRCGNRLVDPGVAIDEVLERCGEPSFRDFSTEFVSYEAAPGVVVSKPVTIETWTFNRGPSEFVRYLTFRDGRLVRITEGSYGY